jgi:hypothetical protein
LLHRLYKLRGHPHTSLAYTTLDHVVGPKLSTDPPDVCGPIVILERRVAGDDKDNIADGKKGKPGGAQRDCVITPQFRRPSS